MQTQITLKHDRRKYYWTGGSFLTLQEIKALNIDPLAFTFTEEEQVKRQIQNISAFFATKIAWFESNNLITQANNQRKLRDKVQFEIKPIHVY